MLPAAVLYTLYRKAALHGFIDLSSYDLVVLGILLIENKPMRYSALYSYSKELGFGNYPMLTEALKYCAAHDYITRECIGNSVVYTIAYSGRAILDRVNTKLDQCVKEQIMKYGNGLPE